MKARLNITGVTPLMQHNVQLASPLNRYAKEMKRISGKRVKTDEDRLDLARIEFEGGLYLDADLGPIVQTQAIQKVLVEAARITKAGKKIERGVQPLGTVVKLEYRGPRTVDGLWNAGDGGIDSPFVDYRSVKVQQNRVDRCRPIFRDWSLTSEVWLDESLLDLDELVEIVDRAGSMVGLLEARTIGFGRFSAAVEEI